MNQIASNMFDYFSLRNGIGNYQIKDLELNVYHPSYGIQNLTKEYGIDFDFMFYESITMLCKVYIETKFPFASNLKIRNYLFRNINCQS